MSDITRDDLRIAHDGLSNVATRPIHDRDVPAILRALLTDECDCDHRGMVEADYGNVIHDVQCGRCGGRGWLLNQRFGDLIDDIGDHSDAGLRPILQLVYDWLEAEHE